VCTSAILLGMEPCRMSSTAEAQGTLQQRHTIVRCCNLRFLEI
jgi:hypothetical protein